MELVSVMCLTNIVVCVQWNVWKLFVEVKVSDVLQCINRQLFIGI